MAQSDKFVSIFKEKQKRGLCEIGMHLHSWNSPPLYELNRACDGRAYITEYPKSVMKKKVVFLKNHLEEKFECEINSHRSGRWALNEEYVSCLIEAGVTTDCSVTPHVNWGKNVGCTACSHGNNYQKFPENTYLMSGKSLTQTIDRNEISESTATDYLWEVPMTIRKKDILDHNKSLLKTVKNVRKYYKGYLKVWLRPNGHNLDDMMKLVDDVYTSDSDYLEFMIHSSELMPGGSPTFPNEDSINKLYNDLEKLFEHISKSYGGCTLNQYVLKKIGEKYVEK